MPFQYKCVYFVSTALQKGLAINIILNIFYIIYSEKYIRKCLELAFAILASRGRVLCCIEIYEKIILFLTCNTFWSMIYIYISHIYIYIYIYICDISVFLF